MALPNEHYGLLTEDHGRSMFGPVKNGGYGPPPMSANTGVAKPPGPKPRSMYPQKPKNAGYGLSR